jgi:hypothetical protein
MTPSNRLEARVEPLRCMNPLDSGADGIKSKETLDLCLRGRLLDSCQAHEIRFDGDEIPYGEQAVGFSRDRIGSLLLRANYWISDQISGSFSTSHGLHTKYRTVAGFPRPKGPRPRETVSPLPLCSIVPPHHWKDIVRTIGTVQCMHAWHLGKRRLCGLKCQPQSWISSYLAILGQYCTVLYSSGVLSALTHR